MTIGDYNISYKNKKWSAIDMDEISQQLSDKICVNVSGDTAYSYGAKYICDLGDGEKRTFYVLEDGDTTALNESTGRIAQSGEVSLIMNRNLYGLDDRDTSVAWVTVKDIINVKGDDYDEIGEDYVCNHDGTYCISTSEYITNQYGPITANKHLAEKTIEWNKIIDKTKVTLPTGNQIAQAINFDIWKSDAFF